MLLVLILVPMASLLWGVTNHIDKHLISKISKNGDYKGLLIFSSLVAGMLLFPISLIICKFKLSVDIKFLFMIFVASILYLFGTLFYFKALKKNDASLVTSMFQLIPVFGYFLGLIFLKEILTIKQIIGGIIVISSSIAITYEMGNKKFDKTKLYALLFMSLSSLSYAVYFLLFRFTTVENNFYTMFFWYQMGLILCGILIITISKSYRKSFFDIVRENGKKVFGFNLINEGLNIIANMLVNFSVTLAPMAIVLILNGLQPLFAFLIGIIGVVLLPKIFSEDIKKETIIQKIICIIISIIGLAILYL